MMNKTHGPMYSAICAWGVRWQHGKEGNYKPDNTNYMQKLRSWRSAVSYFTVAALALQILGGVTAANKVHAAETPSLIINEINWAGSAMSTQDTWVELYNNGPIFSDTVSLCTDTGTVFTTDVNLLPNTYLLVRNNAISAATSTLTPFASGPATAVDLSALPTTASNLYLESGTCDTSATVLDSITGTNTTPAPFKGVQNNHGIYSSMERVAANGSLNSSWVDAADNQTVGRYIEPGVVTQFATPFEENVTLAVPQHVTLTPNGNTLQFSDVTISGTVDPTTYAIEIFRTIHNSVPADSTFIFPPIHITPDAENHFTVTTSVPTQVVGVYDFSLRALNGPQALQSDRSDLASVISEQMNGTTEVITPVVSTVAAPLFTTVSPLYTKTMDAPITGTAVGAAKVVILSNGEYFTTVPVTAEGIFSFDGILTANSKTDFMAVAVDNEGIYSVLSAPFTVWQDSIAPDPVNAADVTSNLNGLGNIISLQSSAGAVTINPIDGTLTVFVYADAAKTQLLAGPLAVNPDGSFAPASMPTSTFGVVYVTVKDQAGNESVVTAISNPLNVGSTTPGALNPHVVRVGSDRATLGWSTLPAADHYLVKYKLADGTYTQPMAECLNVTTCAPEVTITGLNPATQYVFAIAAVDRYGNAGAYTELAFTTATPAPTITTAQSTTPAVTKPVSRNTDKVTTTVTPTPAATVSPSPSASPDNGDVQSASTDNTTRNWTPWIVLAILLAIALLATIGYFYWFGGEAGEAALAASIAAKERELDAAATKKEKSSSDSSKSSKPKPPKDKRW